MNSIGAGWESNNDVPEIWHWMSLSLQFTPPSSLFIYNFSNSLSTRLCVFIICIYHWHYPFIRTQISQCSQTTPETLYQTLFSKSTIAYASLSSLPVFLLQATNYENSILCAPPYHKSKLYMVNFHNSLPRSIAWKTIQMISNNSLTQSPEIGFLIGWYRFNIL